MLDVKLVKFGHVSSFNCLKKKTDAPREITSLDRPTRSRAILLCTQQYTADIF